MINKKNIQNTKQKSKWQFKLTLPNVFKTPLFYISGLVVVIFVLMVKQHFLKIDELQASKNLKIIERNNSQKRLSFNEKEYLKYKDLNELRNETEISISQEKKRIEKLLKPISRGNLVFKTVEIDNIKNKDKELCYNKVNGYYLFENRKGIEPLENLITLYSNRHLTNLANLKLKRLNKTKARWHFTIEN